MGEFIKGREGASGPCNPQVASGADAPFPENRGDCREIMCGRTSEKDAVYPGLRGDEMVFLA